MPTPDVPPRPRLLVRGGVLLCPTAPYAPAPGDLLLEDGRIAARGAIDARRARDARVVDARGGAVIPGLVQAHVHLCQTLFRGLAEGLELVRWLRERIWPLEGAHDPDTLRASVRLGAAELLLGGTTAVQDMGTVRHQDAAFEALRDSGIRAVAGKAMMDAGEDVPEGLRETTNASLSESIASCERWDGAAGGRLRYAFAPRFALSATAGLLRDVAAEAARRRVRVHTHAAESRDECDLVERAVGRGVVEYFGDLGLLGDRTSLAHGVWLTGRDRERLAASGVHVVHCPTSNLKLGSGIADVRALLDAGVNVAVGADGAACNNTLDAFQEMRLTALLGAYLHEPGALDAGVVFDMATRRGARALGLEAEIGTLEVGKRADVVVLGLDGAHVRPGEGSALVDRLVFGARPSDVRTVIVDGDVLVADGRLTRDDHAALARDADAARAAVLARAGALAA